MNEMKLHSQNAIIFAVRCNNIRGNQFELFFAVTIISLFGASLIISRRGSSVR